MNIARSLRHLTFSAKTNHRCFKSAPYHGQRVTLQKQWTEWSIAIEELWRNCFCNCNSKPLSSNRPKTILREIGSCAAVHYTSSKPSGAFFKP